MIEFLTSLLFSKTFAVLTVLGTAFYLYSRHRYSYWTRIGIDGPPLNIFRLFYGIVVFMTKPLHNLEEEMWKKYGKIYGIYELFRPILRVGDPELIKNILVKDFHLFVNRRTQKFGDVAFDDAMFSAHDDHWKKLRSIISPTFSSGKMKKMYHLVEECVESGVEVLEKAANKSSDVELKNCFGNLTMDVIGRCAFATKLNTHENDKHPFVENAKKVFNFGARIWVIFLPLWLRIKLNIGIINPSAVRFFEAAVEQLKSERSKSQTKRGVDFLQLMIDAQKNKLEIDEDDKDENKDEVNVSKNSMKSSLRNEPLSDSEVFANCFTFFFAGYETTASLMSFLMYNVTINPECQQKLFEEISDAVDEKGHISYDKLANLEYLEACINETLRLHTSILLLERSPSEDYKLGDTGIVVEKDIVIQIPIHCIHHSEEFYPDPHRFIPDRFLPENRDKLVPYTFLPFGAGPRNCVGMRFALMEAKLAIVKIVQKFEFVRCEKTKVPLEFKPGAGLLMAKDVTVKVQKRV